MIVAVTCIVGPPGGGPLLRLFGLVAWNGWGNVGSAHLACVWLRRFGGVGPLEQHIGWVALDQGYGLVAWNNWAAWDQRIWCAFGGVGFSGVDLAAYG